MKKSNFVKGILVLSSVCLLAGIQTNHYVYADDTEPETEYYVCLSTQNYNVKNANKLVADGDHYVLKNVTLTSATEFYVISSNQDKYYASDGTNMKVEETSSIRYDIYFSLDYVYDEAKVTDTSLYASNAHITYEYYIPGNYEVSVNAGTPLNLDYNPFESAYDLYYLSSISLNKDDVVVVTDKNDASNTWTMDPVASEGSYRLYFTPGKEYNGNTYAYNSDGTYGTGDDYKYNIHLYDEDFYYISFENELTYKGTLETLNISDTQSVDGYRLTRNEKLPDAEVYDSGEFFNNVKDTKVKYSIYYYSSILKTYTLIDDDNDEDTLVSKYTLSDVSWYSYKLTIAEDKYTRAVSKETKDFQGYYMVGDFNHYGYDENGEINVDKALDENGKQIYLFSKINALSSYYTSDYDQYLLTYKLYPEDLDADENNFEFVITNGKNTYGNGTGNIALNTPGTYDIVFSTDHDYGNGARYKYLLTENDTTYTSVNIDSVDDFLKLIEEWNNDSEASKYKKYYLTADLDLKGKKVPSISVFNGELFGNGHTISHLTIENEESQNGIGLFQLVTKSAVISDLNFTNVNINAENGTYVGVIAKNYGVIENITVSGKIVGKSYVGAVGYNGNYTIGSTDASVDSTKTYGYGRMTNVTNNAEVEGKINVGGIAGFSGGKIINCQNNGKINVRSYSSSTTVTNIGGLVGYSTGTILNSINNGKVGYKNTGSNVGGIAGLSSGLIYYTSNEASITGKNNVSGGVGYYGVESKSTDNNTYSNIQSSIENTLNVSSDDELDYNEETDLANHGIYYVYNTGAVNGSGYAGGLIGYNNAADLKLNNSYNTGDVVAGSGSYVGGLVGYFNGGTISDCFASCSVSAEGTINQYVGGIAGYSNGTVKNSFASCVMTGNEYIGGIIGYGTSTSYVVSTYSNALISCKSNASYVGGIAGYIDGIDESSATYGDRVKYNYYVGTKNNTDFGGIAKINYGLTSKYAAYRVSIEELVSKGELSSTLNHNFGKTDATDDEEATYSFYASRSDNYYPLLKHFYECETIDDEDFDDEDIYQNYSRYFVYHSNIYHAALENSAKAFVRIMFKEWVEDEGDNDDYDNYDINEVIRVNLGENLPTGTTYKYAELRDGEYYFDGDTASYKVSWGEVGSTYENKIVYSEYEEVVTSIYDSTYDIYVSGNFQANTSLLVSKDSKGMYKLTFTENGKEVIYENITVSVGSKAPDYNGPYVDGKQVSSKTYGSYIKFVLSDSSKQFKIGSIDVPFSKLPTWKKAAIIGPIAGVFVVMIIISIIGKIIRKKKAKKEVIGKTQE